MIAIVTDSTAYLTHQEAAQLGVVVVPMSYSLDGGASINEGCIEQNDDCEQLVNRYIDTIHTSQATLTAFHATFSRLRKAGFEVLCLPMSSRLSGTCANAVLAAQELGGPIRVVDSLTTCSGLYLLIYRAYEMVQEGKSLEEIEAALTALREKGRTYFSVDDMTPLRRSGRLGNVKSSISTILNIKPLLAVREGAIVSVGVARGKIDQMRRLTKCAEGVKGPLVVSHFLAGDAAKDLEKQLTAQGRQIQSRRVGPVLGAHLGSGCIGLSWISQD